MLYTYVYIDLYVDDNKDIMNWIEFIDMFMSMTTPFEPQI